MKGLLLRGVIEKGQLLHEGNFIFGKALVDAHVLEIKAKYPRVILSDNTLKILLCKGDALKQVLDCKYLEQDEAFSVCQKSTYIIRKLLEFTELYSIIDNLDKLR